MYDVSKAIGGVVNSKDLTSRMSVIGPDIDPKSTGLFNWFMVQSGTIEGYSKAIWNRVTTIELLDTNAVFAKDGIRWERLNNRRIGRKKDMN